MALTLIILCASFLAAVAMGNGWWGVLGALLLFLAMWSFYLPHTYRLDGAGVSKRSVFGEERRRWEEIRSFYVDRYGVLLSPFVQPTRLARFRGISVQFGPGNREEVLEIIRSRVGDSRPAATGD